MGKFHGVIKPQTPTGSYLVVTKLFWSFLGTALPSMVFPWNQKLSLKTTRWTPIEACKPIMCSEVDAWRCAVNHLKTTLQWLGTDRSV